ncbi:MAG: carboxymuconolactone decarboxylase family protein [Thermoplasmata archaeon]
MQKLDEFYKTIEVLSKNYPQEVATFMAFLERVERKGALDTKTKELIALAAGMVKHCEWCIAYHVKAAKDAGATKQEIFEAAWVGALMDGGPGIAHMFPVIRAVEELGVK